MRRRCIQNWLLMGGGEGRAALICHRDPPAGPGRSGIGDGAASCRVLSAGRGREPALQRKPWGAQRTVLPENCATHPACTLSWRFVRAGSACPGAPTPPTHLPAAEVTASELSGQKTPVVFPSPAPWCEGHACVVCFVAWHPWLVIPGWASAASGLCRLLPE